MPLPETKVFPGIPARHDTKDAGRFYVFDFDRGWLIREGVDVREIAASGSGALRPTEKQFRETAGRIKKSARPAALEWPATDPQGVPAWYGPAFEESLAR